MALSTPRFCWLCHGILAGTDATLMERFYINYKNRAVSLENPVHPFRLCMYIVKYLGIILLYANMLLNPLSILSIYVVATAVAAASSTASLPSLIVPECPHYGVATINQSDPERTLFPLTTASLCYNETSLQIKFEAYDETNYYYNASQTTNDDIWEYEVMEAFIYHGTNNPTTYLEFEINPNNVTYQAIVFNPSEVRATGAPFDHFFVTDPAGDGFSASTTLDRKARTWTSTVQIPLALFDVGVLKGSLWRMNFFRTITSPSTYPDQTLGAWSPTNQASFHMTPFFGNVIFV
ncbi:conserved hypothetical protein [Talaromyces stipitatus ATCC 10500]|uniref:Carbohydrate-binding domain-containing protein n=1 Tax=Talaromyces stipitatus (strain ATCC 10500 / CBS 375.48 / QM 6759 / NRRL 1006) TaxID=441959 RepID=B8MJV0_TALSN|nr:uncharacterized protein TSTA_042420 [Talaromyces stipitatus ATCC 10500]EED14767.1 conserved hypothetical protein [Talaromyces stipitatus ATCC 10500]